MFEKLRNCRCVYEMPSRNSLNIISQATSLSGNLKTIGDFRVEGKMVGNIECQGKIVIGIDGLVEGNICADSVDLFGKQTGDIQAFSSCILRTGSVCYGKIQTDIIEVEPGANFHGDCETNKANDIKQIA